MNKILGIRDKELKVLRTGSILTALTYVMWFCSAFIVSFSSCIIMYIIIFCMFDVLSRLGIAGCISGQFHKSI